MLGIGRQLCITLAKSSPKVKVFALAKTQSNLDSLKAEFPNIETICVDLGDWNATRLAVESVLPIDGLVNNAGTSVLAPMLETTPEMIDMYATIIEIEIHTYDMTLYKRSGIFSGVWTYENP